MTEAITRNDLHRIFVTSDHHFGHANIIKFCNRPFADVEEMDRVLIDNWNKIVSPDDIVYHLGDFTLGDKKEADKYFRQLNGYIRILANEWHHDKRWLSDKFGDVSNFYSGLSNDKGGHKIAILPPIVVLEIPGVDDGYQLAITLCHYPLAIWDRKHYNAWHLHGHSHGNYKGEGFVLDVGVDCTNYHPISLGGILELMYGRGFI